jgi:hypothetical protein
MPIVTTRTRWTRIVNRFGLRGPESLRTALAADFRGSTARQKLALIGVAIWLVYEWGPGNETLTPWIVANTIGQNSRAGVIPITAAVGFCFTAVQQMASGYTALAGFSMFDRTSQAAWERLRGASDVAPGEWSRLGWGARCIVVFGLGTTAVALIQIMTIGEIGVRRHAAAVRSSALLCATLVGVIGGLAATIAYVGRRVDSLSWTTEWILRILGNPLFWLGLLLVPAMYRAFRRRPSVVDDSRIG